MNAPILVTGSSGYVGSHTVKFLVKQGEAVVGLDARPPSPQIRRYLADHLVSDMADPSVADFLRRTSPAGVIHCAAKCLVGESVQNPELYFDHNVRRSRVFVEMALKARVRSLVFSSSAAVYGEPVKTPIPEEHPKNPINPYGRSKADFETFLLSDDVRTRLRVGIVRYFNAAGADPEGEIGEVHDPETHLIPNAVLAGLGVRKEFELFGTDYPTRDGTCVRDFIHVWDLAEAHRILLRRLESGKGGEVYNLGSSDGYTVREVLSEVGRQLGREVSTAEKPRRPGDPVVLIADAARALKDLGWKRTLSDLPEIVATALAWHRKSRRL
ncbi:MAG: UDP-glucose 4-epimerase GalE [Pseudomonadota bacterium]